MSRATILRAVARGATPPATRTRQIQSLQSTSSLWMRSAVANVELQQIRFKSTAQSNTPASRKKSPPSFTSRNQNQRGGAGGSHQSHGQDPLVVQLQQLVPRGSAATTRDFEPDLDFLRHAATLLQSAHTPEQLRAALPLCKIVERAETVHSSASGECVRIYEALGRSRDSVELALRLLRHDFFLMNTVLASAVQACASLKDTDRGFQIYELAVQRGTIPNRHVFGALLALSAAAGDAPSSSPRLVELLSHMQQHSGAEMNHTTFHHWMTSYAKAGFYEHVAELFSTSESLYGLKPTAATYAIYMDACAEQGDYDKTLALLEELKMNQKTKNQKAKTSEASGGEEEVPQAALVHYNVALKACGKSSQLTQAFHLYEEMKHRGISPDLVTYITMMHAVYHGELGAINPTHVKLAMGGVGALTLASVPFMDGLQDHYMTVLFCGSLVGSMGLAVYMNPDGAMRALYPNADDTGPNGRRESVIEAFFRRLREEDHCGRSMYLWREMLKRNVAPDSRVVDVLVRTCVKKRHPELAFEAVFDPSTSAANSALVDAESGQFVLPLGTTVSLLQSLLSQRRMALADTVFDQARAHRAFKELFTETKELYTYDLRMFPTPQSRSYAVRRLLVQLHAESKLFGSGATRAHLLPRVEFLVLHGFDLLDQIDKDDAQLRALFSMDEMTREPSPHHQSNHHQSNLTTSTHDTSSSTHGQYFFRLSVPRERLAAFFQAPLASATQHTL